MYKLLIADDEPTALKFIHFILEQNSLPIYVCAEGENGEQAVELVDIHQPDIVIIDINMPFMDGLTAAEKIKEKYPSTKIYILTAYEYFEYAQKAVKIKVEDYLLKPLKGETLIEILQSGIDQIASERNEKNEVMNIRKQLEDMKQVVKEKLINELIMGKDLSLIKYSQAAFFPLDNLKFLGILSVSQLENQPNKFTVLEDLLKELDKQIGFGLYSVSADGEGILFLEEKCNKDLVIKIPHILERWHTKFDLDFAMGIAVNVKEGEVISTYKEAAEARKTAIFWGLKGVFSSEDFSTFSYELSDVMETQQNLYDRIIEKKDFDFQDIYKRIKPNSERNKYCYPEIIYFFKQIITILVSNLADFLPTKEHTKLLIEFEGRIERVNKIQEIKDIFEDLIGILGCKIEKTGHNQAETMVNLSLVYINQNYSKALTLKKVADQLFLSPSYFSRIFKKHTGKGFVKYLVSLRIDHAYKLLLTGKYTVAEVSSKVGFDDPSYFSFVFKKEKNQNPIQVINSIHEKQKFQNG